MRGSVLIAVLGAALACQGKSVPDERDGVAGVLRDIPREKLDKVVRAKIYFGHQSVGYDIVGGLGALAKERPDLSLNIVETRDADAIAGPAFAHAKNGQNLHPLTKIQDFADTLERGGLGTRTDIALFKFCYVDFEPQTDVEKVFAEYRSTLARLRQTFPGVKFVHVTSPLTIVQSGPKAWAKQILGRKLGGAEANLARERFNELIRKEYSGREPVFDLAAIESTLPDGTTVRFRDGGRRHPALADVYASDGKHLNPLGARWAAAHLLATLASVVD
jgi:hypothetical protein